jgi:hypothetical protein
MLALHLEYRGSGTFQVRSKRDLELAETNFVRGEPVQAKVTKRRSVRQNALFHALIQAAFDNQRGGPILPTWEHLRAHVLIQAGHCDEVRVNLKGLPIEHVPAVVAPIAAALRRQVDVVETSYDKRTHEMVLRLAKKWRFSATDRDTANAVFAKVLAYLADEIVPGVEPTTLLDMAKDAA